VAPNGSFSLWRTIAWLSRPPSPVGRFAGALDGGALERIADLVAVAYRTDPVLSALPPDAARERLLLGERVSSWADDASPAPPFGDLARELRQLLTELTRFPDAAVVLEMSGQGAVLALLGGGEIELDLSGAVMRTISPAAGPAAHSSDTRINGPRSVVAGPGWRYELPVARTAGSALRVDELLAFDGEFWRACSLESAPAR